MQLLTLSRRHSRFFREILISQTLPLVRMSWQTSLGKMPSAEEERLLLKKQVVLLEVDRWTNLSRAINKISTVILTLTWEWVVKLDLLAKDLQWVNHQWVEIPQWEAVLKWVATLQWVFAQWDLLRAYLLEELDHPVFLLALVHSSETTVHKTP